MSYFQMILIESTHYLLMQYQATNNFMVALTSAVSLGTPVPTSINGVDISSYVNKIFPGVGLTFQMTTAFYATQRPGTDVSWYACLFSNVEGSFNL